MHAACDLTRRVQARDGFAVGSDHSEELDLGIGIVRPHEPRRVHLHPLQVDALAANGLAHLDAVTSAMIAVRGRQVHQTGTVQREQRILCAVRTEPPEYQITGPNSVKSAPPFS